MKLGLTTHLDFRQAVNSLPRQLVLCSKVSCVCVGMRSKRLSLEWQVIKRWQLRPKLLYSGGSSATVPQSCFKRLFATPFSVGHDEARARYVELIVTRFAAWILKPFHDSNFYFWATYRKWHFNNRNSMTHKSWSSFDFSDSRINLSTTNNQICR